MSSPYFVFSCTYCDFLATDKVLWGLFSYQGPQGLVPIERQVGWCNGCQDLEPIEVLPSEDRIRIIENRDYPEFFSGLGRTEQLSEFDKAKELEYQKEQRECELKEEKSFEILQ